MQTATRKMSQAAIAYREEEIAKGEIKPEWANEKWSRELINSLCQFLVDNQ